MSVKDEARVKRSRQEIDGDEKNTELIKEDKEKKIENDDQDSDKISEFSSSGSESDEKEVDDNGEQIINVDFEFFDPSDIDYHGLKSLLTQTFQNDACLFNLGEISDLIIEKNKIGSTIKCDGPKSDPYAVMTVLNINENKGKIKAMSEIVDYLVEKSETAGVKDKFLEIINDSKTGFFINERLINMPPQVVPSLLKMMNEEIQWDIEDGNKNMNLKYVIYISKVYREIESTLEEKDGVVIDTKDMPQRKKGRKMAKKDSPLFYFQIEDEFLEQKAEFTFEYRFSKASQSADSKRAFQDAGITPLRKVFILPFSVLSTIQPELEVLLQ